MRAVLFILAMLGLAGWATAGGMLKPGDVFPAWDLKDNNGTSVTSASLAGKIYLFWYYPKAMTPGCTKEGCELRDNFEAFKKLNVEILGVSFDDPESNAKFVAKESFQFRLLSDTTRGFAVAVGAADSTSRLWARRISYLVGADGKVLKAYDNVSPGTHATQVLADLAAWKK